jgi:hypothetical protein
MNREIRVKQWIAGAAIGLTAALLIWPSTRWIVGAQAGYTALRSDPLLPIGDQTPAERKSWLQEESRAAERRPDDLQIQLANAADTGSTSEDTSQANVARIRALASRFPGRASIYANALRWAATSLARSHRPEESELTAGGSGAKAAASEPPDQAALAAFLQDAAEGERLDPDNGYFPAMASAALFALHRDAEALDALKRAAARPTWREYFDDEVRGRLRLIDAAFGAGSALARLGVACATLFPEYAMLRSTSRMAVVQAVRAEQAGRPEEGLAIRRCVQQIGIRMLDNSHIVIGSLVGVAIWNVAMARPGGAPPERAGTSGAEQRRTRTLDAYRAYLTQIGHAGDISNLDAEAQVCQEGRSIFQAGIAAQPAGVLAGVDCVTTAMLWTAGILALSGAVWMGLLALAGGYITRRPVIRAGSAPDNRRIAMLGGAAIVCLAAACVVTAYRAGAPPPWSLGLLAASGLLAILATCMGAIGALRGFRNLALCFAGSALLGAVISWQAGAAISPFVRIVTGIVPGLKVYWAYAGGCVVVALPVLLICVLGIVSRRCRVPILLGVARGLAGIAGTIAACLLICFGILAVFTSRLEAYNRVTIERAIDNEPALYASLAGKHWPVRR